MDILKFNLLKTFSKRSYVIRNIFEHNLNVLNDECSTTYFTEIYVNPVIDISFQL